MVAYLSCVQPKRSPQDMRMNVVNNKQKTRRGILTLHQHPTTYREMTVARVVWITVAESRSMMLPKRRNPTHEKLTLLQDGMDQTSRTQLLGFVVTELDTHVLRDADVHIVAAVVNSYVKLLASITHMWSSNNANSTKKVLRCAI